MEKVSTTNYNNDLVTIKTKFGDLYTYNYSIDQTSDLIVYHWNCEEKSRFVEILDSDKDVLFEISCDVLKHKSLTTDKLVEYIESLSRQCSTVREFLWRAFLLKTRFCSDYETFKKTYPSPDLPDGNCRIGEYWIIL